MIVLAGGVGRKRGDTRCETATSYLCRPVSALLLLMSCTGARPVLAYTVRLRGIKWDTLTDAEILPDGILNNRRKGSHDNITR